MAIGEWFWKLSESTQLWLVQNMESELPAEVSAEIVAAGGPADSYLGDTENAWLEEVNNGGTPA